MVKEEQILEALKRVVDPDLKKDIVSLGFVKTIQIRDGEVQVQVELTTPACPMKDLMKKQCEQALLRLEGIRKVNVQMTARTVGRKSADEKILPGVKNIIAVASGKGGVGKSTVATNLAAAFAQTGAKTGLLDADIYGPSIPLMMGIHEPPRSDAEGRILPHYRYGIALMSIGFLLPPNEALVWRGPMVANALAQLMSDVLWGELDYLVVDLPPGTGDAQLTLSQTVPLTGAVIVTTPQDVALMDARRGVGMFQKVNVPILGIIENMSYFICPHCSQRTEIFSYGGAKKTSEQYEVPFLGEIPLDPETRIAGDHGHPIVIAKPDSPNARAFTEIAGGIASLISILHKGSSADKANALRQRKFFMVQ